MEVTLYVIVLVTLGMSYGDRHTMRHISQVLIGGESDNLREYCPLESFSAHCDSNQVVLVTNARFGRTQGSRCVDSEVTVPCEVDARTDLHRACSGRTSCEVHISYLDRQLYNKTAGMCSKDHRLSLLAQYTCINVWNDNTQSCPVLPSGVSSSPLPVDVTSSSGYLASVVTEDTGMGSPQCPWHISGQTGQTVQITLINFDSKVQPSDGLCQIYAYISERGLPNSETKLMDCGAPGLQGKVFTSLSKSVDVVLIVEAQGHERHFILNFTVLGCPDIKPPSGSEVIRKGNLTTITCGDTTWTQECKEGQWQGEPRSCASTDSAGSSPWPKGWGQEFTILLIIAVAIVIAVVIVVLGICIVRRRSGNGFQPVSQLGEYGVYGLHGPVAPSKCYYPSLPHPSGPPCPASGSDSSHYTTTIQRRQAVPPGFASPPADLFAGHAHLLQQQDVTSRPSPCPIHTCPSDPMTSSYHDRVGASGWQTFPIRRPDHIYESPKFARKNRHDPPFYHELDPREVERQLQLQKQEEDVSGPPKGVPRIPTEDEIISDDDDLEPLPPPPPALPPDNKK